MLCASPKLMCSTYKSVRNKQEKEDVAIHRVSLASPFDPNSKARNVSPMIYFVTTAGAGSKAINLTLSTQLFLNPQNLTGGLQFKSQQKLPCGSTLSNLPHLNIYL